MKSFVIACIILVILFLGLGALIISKQKANEEFTRQMKENAEKFHEEAVKARQEDLKAGEEFVRKCDEEFWGQCKNNNPSN